MKKYYKQLYTNKLITLYMLDEIDVFLGRCELPKLTQPEQYCIDKINVICCKNFPSNKTTNLDGIFSELYRNNFAETVPEN